MSSYHQLTIGGRKLIFLDHELSFSIHRIAQLIRRASSTISRELHRHTTIVGYRSSIAQKLYQQNKARCSRHYRLANAKVKALIGHLFLDLQWSPEEISKHLIYENSAIHISYNTIYRAIYRGVFNDTGLSHGSRGAIRKLRDRGKSRHTKVYGERRGQIPIPPTIYERPLEAQQRSEIGH